MKLIILSLLMSLFSSLFANGIVGKIELFKGNVKVKSEGSIKKKKVTAGLEIKAGDLIISSMNSSVKIKLSDDSLLILDELSTIHFSSLYAAEQIDGKILYSITSRDAKNSLKVKTPFAVIGIKGTKFIINATDDSSVILKEGLIGVTSLNKEFKLYKKKLEDEFNAYKAEQEKAMQEEKDEFEQYKNSEYKAYDKPIVTKEFDLKAGNHISFNGSNVKEDAFNQDDNSAFDHFDSLVEKMK